MNTGEDIQGMRKVLDMSRGISVILLLLHFYYYCYGAFVHWKLTYLLTDRLLDAVSHTPVFHTRWASLLLAVVFLGLSLAGARGRKDTTYRYGSCFALILSGLALYFGTYYLLSWVEDGVTSAVLYMICTFLGYLLVLAGGTRLSRVIARPLQGSFFNVHRGGLRQEERLIQTDYSIYLPASYVLHGHRRKSYINFINPRRGILILGSPGSGKSWFIIEPAIRQLIEKGFALLVYDFKYDTLSRLAYSWFRQYQDRYTTSARFYSINFTDLSRSHRCNLIDPATLIYVSDAIGASRTILLSMNKTWINRQGEFFVESPINFLGALIWFLRKYKDGQFCTLPHAIELAQVAYDKLFTILGADLEIQTMVNGFIEAYRNKTMELLDSQVASAKVPLARLASPDLYYILTGNDLPLSINDPAAPAILCLGGDPPRQEALAPVLSLYIDRINKLCNRPGRHPCALVCDEFATVRAYSMMTTIATARSNNIIPILAVQDLSQLRTQYSYAEADQLLNITGNLISGQVGGETARWICDRIPPVMQYKTTVSVNSSDTSVSKSEQVTPAVSTATISTLSSGEFVGVVTDDPGKELALKAFHARVKREAARNEVVEELPVVRMVDRAVVEEAFMRVKREVTALVEAEMERILGDPGLKGVVVKK